MKIIFNMYGIEEFLEFCRRRRLRVTNQRRQILETFLETEGHLSAGQLYDLVRRKGIGVGYTTVYRTLGLLVDSGIARRIDLGEREALFEHEISHTHHDHLVCIKCGKSIEFFDPTIEEMQRRIAEENRFTPQRHSLVIHGLCEQCR
jgi:Fur family ferric uptake transcriptional regulator